MVRIDLQKKKQLTDITLSHPENLCAKYIVALKRDGVLDALSPEEREKLFKCIKTGLDNPAYICSDICSCSLKQNIEDR